MNKIFYYFPFETSTFKHKSETNKKSCFNVRAGKIHLLLYVISRMDTQVLTQANHEIHFYQIDYTFLKYYVSKDLCQFKHFGEMPKLEDLLPRVNFVGNNEMTSTSCIQKFSTCMTMNELSTNNGLTSTEKNITNDNTGKNW